LTSHLCAPGAQFCELRDFPQAAHFSDNLSHNRKVTENGATPIQAQAGKL